MSITMPIFSVALPEIVVLSMAMLALLIDVFLPEKFRIVTYITVQAAIILTFIISIYQFYAYPQTVVTFDGQYILDKLAILLKIFISLIMFFIFAYSREYISDRKITFGEYYVLGLLATLGMLIMCSAYSFLTIYLGLELLSLSLYAMVAMQKDSVLAVEAAMKFFVMGALALSLIHI